MKNIFLLSVAFFIFSTSFAQRNPLLAGEINGKITDALSNQPLANVTIQIPSRPEGAESIRTQSDSLGNFSIGNLKPGYYTIEFSLVGYKKQGFTDVQVSNSRPVSLSVALESQVAALAEVQIGAPLFRKPVESPVSLRTIGSTEIKRNPGGNRDISKVIQSLPGVSTQVSFRNDIIIRGGAPNENKFYLDGVEIPNINHFSTQGSSGGPVGMINVDFIKEVGFYSGAFPANRGNTLSSVFEFSQKDGRADKFGASLTVGASDFAAILEGPIGKKTTLLSSYRYSYLQGLFKLLGLPFLPSYQDFQFKTKTKFNSKNELIIMGLGAIDRFKLNFSAENTEENQYILANVPVNSQDNYTIGATYKNFREKGFSTLILSRNFLDNGAIKYQDNNTSKLKTIDYTSQEIENKFRFENSSREGDLKINFGLGAETANYKANTLGLDPTGTINYTSEINLFKYGFFGQLSRPVFNNRVNLSFGLRADANTFSSKMTNPFKTLSPRLSAAFNVSDQFSINFNTGIYYQLPAYTVLGYRVATNSPLLNKNTGYIRSDQLVLGLEYNSSRNTRFTIESFYKMYSDYPMLKILGDTVPLANLGGDFGVVGNRPVTGLTKGRSYGTEFLAQQRLTNGYYGILAVTLFRSEFQDKHGVYIQSSWNSRYILSMTGGKIFSRNWEVGTRFRFSGGGPYTPYDVQLSSLKSNFDVYPQGIQDFDQLNTKRLKDFYQVDIRVDKKYPLRKFNLNIYLDIQNLTYNEYELPANLVPDRDASGNLQNDPANAARYKTKLLDNKSGNILPTIGAIFEF